MNGNGHVNNFDLPEISDVPICPMCADSGGVSMLPSIKHFVEHGAQEYKCVRCDFKIVVSAPVIEQMAQMLATVAAGPPESAAFAGMLRVTGTEHDLKCWPREFAALRNFTKPFEVRVDDRQYAVGDVLRLREYRPNADPRLEGEYTGQEVRGLVTYIYRGDGPIYLPKIDGQQVVVLGLVFAEEGDDDE